MLELKRVRVQIKQQFIELIDCVKARECELLKELDTFLASYHSYRDEFLKQKEKKEAFEKTNAMIEDQMKKSLRFPRKYDRKTENEITSIKFLAEPKMVHFICENNIMFAELNKLGKLAEKVGNSVDYKSVVHPRVSACEKGKGMGLLYSPYGVTVDNKTNNILCCRLY